MYTTRGLLVAITAQLLLFSGVHSGPLHSSEDTQVPDEGAKPEGSIMLEGQGVEDYIEVGEPSEFYLQEVREQVEAQRTAEETQTERDTRSTCSNPTIQHGNTVAFQPLYNKRYWLSCDYNPCRGGAATCPGLFMEGSDWTNCYGEVFQIYRASGPGTVKVGDIVGIHYPRRPGNWLGCSLSNCARATCPGTPTTTYGFQNGEKWLRCYGEVFKIYARGKSLGSAITDQDAVMLFYIQDQNWVGLDTTYVGHRTCPGTVRPPPSDKYDQCWGDVIEIRKQ